MVKSNAGIAEGNIMCLIAVVLSVLQIKRGKMKDKKYQKIMIILLVTLIIIWLIATLLFIKTNNDVLNIIHDVAKMKFEWCEI